MNSIKIKNIKISKQAVNKNILKVYNVSTDLDKNFWYKEANDFCYELVTDKNTLNKIIGVLAALSPVKRWEENKIQAKKMLSTGDCGHIQIFKQKAKDIINSNGEEETILKILNGNKIKSFYLNIKYFESNDNVTIDRHALSIAMGFKINDLFYRGITNNQYNFFVDCYKSTAKKIGITPSYLQSITWVNYRKQK